MSTVEVPTMLFAVAVLLVCQLIGEVISKFFQLPLPGPVIGMLLLFSGLLIRGGVPDRIERTARGLLENLSLLFVPAGVGVVVHISLVAEEWLPITVGLVGSTLATIAVTGLVVVGLDRFRRADKPKRGGNA